MDANRKGAIAETAVTLAATRLGVTVLRPLTDHARYDLAFEIGSELFRIQCKWGRLDRDRGVIVVRVGGSSYGPSGEVRRVYSEDEIDFVAVYCDDLDRCYLLPCSLVAGRKAIHLRLEPPRNGQRACVNLARDFELPGAIAQLGERSAGSRKVAGSSPASSTPATAATVLTVGAHRFREHLGFWLECAAEGNEVLVTRRGRPSVRLLAAQGG